MQFRLPLMTSQISERMRKSQPNLGTTKWGILYFGPIRRKKVRVSVSLSAIPFFILREREEIKLSEGKKLLFISTEKKKKKRNKGKNKWKKGPNTRFFSFLP